MRTAIGTVSIELIDLLGKIVYTKQFNTEKGNQLLKLDLADLPNGMYIFKSKNNTEKMSLASKQTNKYTSYTISNYSRISLFVRKII